MFNFVMVTKMRSVILLLALCSASLAARVPDQDGVFFNPVDDDTVHSSPGEVLSREEQIVYAASELEYYAYQIQFDPATESAPVELPQCPDGQVSLPSNVPEDYPVGIAKRGFFKKLFRPLKGCWDKFRKKITPQQRPRFNVCNLDRIAVDVIFHWHHFQQPGDLNFTNDRIVRQMAAVNTVYNPLGISFNYRGPMRLRVRSDHPKLYDRNAASSTRAATREGSRRTLNIWVTRNVLQEGSTSDISYAFSRFPESKSRDDGITIDHRSFIDESPMTRIANTSGGMGGILMHEIGHWMGLKHTFAPDEQACSEFLTMSEATYRLVNDGLSDTPMLPGDRELDSMGNSVHYRCQQPTCVRGGKALPYSFQNNFMSYSDCQGIDIEPSNWSTAPTPAWTSRGFTAQQRARMFAAFAYFRAFEGITRRTDCRPYDERTKRDILVPYLQSFANIGLTKREEEIGFSSLADPDLLANLQNEELVCVPDVKDENTDPGTGGTDPGTGGTDPGTGGTDPGTGGTDPGTGTPGDGTDNTGDETDPNTGNEGVGDSAGSGTDDPTTGTNNGNTDGLNGSGSSIDAGSTAGSDLGVDGSGAGGEDNGTGADVEANDAGSAGSTSSTTSSDEPVYTGGAPVKGNGRDLAQRARAAFLLALFIGAFC